MRKINEKTEKKAVVLFSGGLDSSTVLKIAIDQGFEVIPLSFFYNQKHKIELTHAKEIADFYGLKNHIVVNLDFSSIKGSALVDPSVEVPKNRIQTMNLGDLSHELSNLSDTTARKNNAQYQNDNEDIPVTYVPARNTVFLSYALAVAEANMAADIFIGVNHLDYSGYPDCRPEFIKAFENMANLATKVSVSGKIKFKINTPLIELSKKEIILKGLKIGVPLERTYSCYDPVNELACGSCDSCILRRNGFLEAGIKDPTKYNIL